MNKRVELFVGLGNPGQKYKNTRHNLGFSILDAIVISRHLKFEAWCNLAKISFCDGINGKIWFLKPMTFMNFSGIAIASFVKHYKIDPEGIFVFFDDLSVPIGKYKIRMLGSGGGHKGVESIIDHLCINSFPRMKFGIGPLPKFTQAADFVLSKFNQEEVYKINLIKEKAIDIFNDINKIGIIKAVSKLDNKNDSNNNEKKQCKEVYSKTGCAKGFVNGPCGSFVDGKCEIDHTKDCAWVLVYERLKNYGTLKKFLNQYIEPKK